MLSAPAFFMRQNAQLCKYQLRTNNRHIEEVVGYRATF